MSRIFIAGHGVYTDVERPEFRKATRNMIRVQTAIEAALAGRRDLIGSSLGLVFGSSHGELDVTMNFLKTLDETGMARPILFQNSLHNSTAGFAAMNLCITGPMLTVSDLSFTGEDALNAGLLFLKNGLCDYCLVAAAESRVPQLETGQKTETGEGAAAVLLCNEEGWRRTGIDPIAELISVRCHRERSVPVPVGDYYESNAIELMSRSISNADISILKQAKPNGWWSEMKWRHLP